MSSSVFEIKDTIFVTLLLTRDPERKKQEREHARRVVLETDRFSTIFKLL